MEKYAPEMYALLEKIYSWLMKDAEILARPTYIIRLFDELDALLYKIRDEAVARPGNLQ